MSPTGSGGHERGFTLLELLIVIALAGVFGVFAVDAYSRAQDGWQLRTVAEAIAKDLKRARNLSLRNARAADFVFDVQNRRYGVDGMATGGVVPAHMDLEFVAAREVSGRQGVGRVRFFPDGTATGGRLVVRNHALQRVIRIDWLTGRVDVAR